MIFKEIQNPTFSAPDGMRLSDPLALHPLDLSPHHLTIVGMSVLDDLSVEMIFSFFEYAFLDNMDGLAEIRCGEDDCHTYIDKHYEELKEEVIDHMKEWAVDALEKSGISSDALIDEPQIDLFGDETPILMKVRFFGEPDPTYELDEPIGSMMETRIGERQIDVANLTISMILSANQDDPSQAEIDEDPLDRDEFGEQLKWGFPWYMHWAMEDICLRDHEVSEDKQTATFTYDLSYWTGDSYSAEEIKMGNCGALSSMSAWRAILIDKKINNTQPSTTEVIVV